MSFHHQVTFKCDVCDQNYTIDEDAMEIPPGWLGLQIVIADTDGCIPQHEQEIYCHFCTQECLIEYTSGDEIRRRLCTADKDSEEDSEEPDDEDQLST